MTQDYSELLKKPYHRVVFPDDDIFGAEMLEFPGCLAIGDTAAEALASLERVAESWLEVTIGNGQTVPEPLEQSPGRAIRELMQERDSARKAAENWVKQTMNAEYGCGRSYNCCNAAFVCRVCGTRWVGYRDAPEME